MRLIAEIATARLPLTDELIARLAGLPLTPLLVWPVGARGWLGIGLGDLLLATVGPLVFRQAIGRAAGITVLVIALAAIGAVFPLPLAGLPRGAFPVMVVRPVSARGAGDTRVCGWDEG